MNANKHSRTLIRKAFAENMRHALSFLAAAGILLAHIPASAQTAPAYVFVNFAGSPFTTGSADGLGNIASFNYPYGITSYNSNILFVSDFGNHTIRKITAAGDVTTFVGSAGNIGANDDIGSAAMFNHPTGMAVDSLSNLFVADFDNHTIRKITSAGL